MYVPPAVLASLDAVKLLEPVYGKNPMCGNEGNGPNPGVGNGSCHSPV
jgi:hypothetical protein